jgi:uncharacterized protein DUF3105
MINRYTFAGLLAVVAVIGIVALGVFAVSGGDDGGARPTDRAADTGAPPPPNPTASASPTAQDSKVTALPAQKTKDLAQAARRAGCTVKTEPNEGAEHVTREVTPADYGTNPPTSGIHNPVWASDEIYAPGTTPALGELVHTLEHGRIDIQYHPGTDAKTIALLGQLYKQMDNGYHLLLFENGTEMPFAVAATAWNHLLGCGKTNDKVFDAIRAFTAAYIDKGPETVP